MTEIARELGLAQTLSIGRLVGKLQEIKETEEKLGSKAVTAQETPNLITETDAKDAD
jgi:hypothetical protein